MAEASLKIAVNTQELEKAIVEMDKFSGVNKSALKAMRDMEYKMMDVGRSVSNVEKVTRQITDTTGKYYNATQEVKDGLIAQAKELDSVAKATGRATVAANDSIKANNGANTSYKGTGGAIRNVSYQIQDFATQVGAGTSAATALGQQLPQLLSGFGLMGVVIGTATAVLIPLANTFGFFDTALDKATKSFNKFKEAIKASSQFGDDISEFAKSFSNSTANGFADYVEAYNKASRSQQAVMQEGYDLRLKMFKLQLEEDKLTLEQGNKYERAAKQALNWNPFDILPKGMPNIGNPITSALSNLGGSSTSDMIKQAGGFGQSEESRKLLEMQIKNAEQVLQDLQNPSKLLGQSDKARGLGISFEQTIESLKSEAQYIGLNNAEKEKGMVIAQKEAEFKRAGMSLSESQKQQLRDIIDLKHESLQEKEITKYSQAQQTANDILREQTNVINVNSRENQKFIEQEKLKGFIAQQTVGWNQQEIDKFKEKAQYYLAEKQALDDIQYAKQRTFGGGATAAIVKYGEDAANVGTQVGNAFTNAFKGMEDAVVQFTMTGKASFSSFAMSVIADIQRILVRQALLAPIAGGLTSLLGTIGGSLAGSAAGGASSSFGSITAPSGTSSFGSLNSGVSQGFGIRAYAVGTNYVPNDQLAMIHKGEAIVPAAYNPAAGGIGGGNINNVTVNVNTGGQDSSTSNSQDASKLGALISNVVKATIIKEQRNGGLLSGA